MTHQNAIKSAWISSALYMTQYSDTRILIELRNDSFPNIFGGDRIPITINGSLSYNDDIQTLTSITFLNIKSNSIVNTAKPIGDNFVHSFANAWF